MNSDGLVRLSPGEIRWIEWVLKNLAEAMRKGKK